MQRKICPSGFPTKPDHQLTFIPHRPSTPKIVLRRVRRINQDLVDKYTHNLCVEPIVRLTERVLEGSAGAEFTFLASLDASNAFNRVDRAEMAAAVKTHGPTLWRTCKWAYGDSSYLVCGDKVLQSSQGVRQGDPFGPLFFSITLRPTLNALCQSLGPSTQALAYLDDIYLFPNDSQVLSKTTQFLADKQHIIKLNERNAS